MLHIDGAVNSEWMPGQYSASGSIQPEIKNFLVDQILKPVQKILGPDDPAPYEEFPATSDTPVVLCCDHAGNAMPKAIQNLRPSGYDMNRHIAIDVGARKLAIKIAENLGACLITQYYSRLVIDPNRTRKSRQLAATVSDCTVIPFNQNLSDQDLDERWNSIHKPYHNKIDSVLEKRAGKPTVFIAIHSFSPKLRGAPARPWVVDLIVRTDQTLAKLIKSGIESDIPGINVGINQVFKITKKVNYSLAVHAETRGLPNVSIEVRNDWVSNPYQIEYWGKLLARVIESAIPAVVLQKEQVS